MPVGVECSKITLWWHTLPDLTKRKVSLIFLVAYTMYVNRFSAFDRWELGELGLMTEKLGMNLDATPEMKRYFYRVKTYPWIVLTYFTSLKTIWWFRLGGWVGWLYPWTALAYFTSLKTIWWFSLGSWVGWQYPISEWIQILPAYLRYGVFSKENGG